mmetsp:Transcript_44160/g.70620  ORF Transcript_44160/g.70620 Transcript_44160/m.70620 type:complete len:325 (+) Transcript_44160:380-1354(+)|eukprot:CAMPEP_0203755290 /NCGR_PEP_ID=MMETSP0098-20131031/8753_1 /ASSEMBLY_ACC=CAM_ASM_000208 /TAXON_ID=96639 /ORGANISM=" , Strain NY0313808BC1" /LENGTH=324 /DNA_ID=CAMNT_0050646679 /DNA_START=335 /DNA_END=1309 /DNA_ORIENTATION=-
MTELSRSEKLVGQLLGEVDEITCRCEERRSQDAIRVKDIFELVGAELKVVAEKCGKRSKEVDPVSGEMKRGDKYRARVEAFALQVETLSQRTLQLIGKLDGVAEAEEASKREEERRREAEAQAAKKLADQLAKQRELEEEEERRKQKEIEEIQHRERLEMAAEKVALAKITEEDRIYRSDSKAIKTFMHQRVPGTNSVEDAIALVQANAAIDDTRREGACRALKDLGRLLERIVAHPESEPCRLINAANKTFRENIASVPGTRELLAGAGFELKFYTVEDEEGVETQHVEYFLKEPDLATEMDKWTAWFEQVKITHALVAACRV